jgi:predicted acyltransferase
MKMTVQADGETRLASVDVCRGMTIVAMILVNNPGSWETTYRPLKHAEWHGWTPTDLVFPFFLFIVGVAIVLARTLAYLQIDGVPLKQLIHGHLFASWLPPYVASLGYAMAWIGGWFLVLYWMYLRRLYIKI